MRIKWFTNGAYRTWRRYFLRVLGWHPKRALAWNISTSHLSELMSNDPRLPGMDVIGSDTSDALHAATRTGIGCSLQVIFVHRALAGCSFFSSAIERISCRSDTLSGMYRVEQFEEFVQEIEQAVQSGLKEVADFSHVNQSLQ